MVWAVIRVNYRTDLVVFDGYVNADVYVDEVYDHTWFHSSENIETSPCSSRTMLDPIQLPSVRTF